MRLNNTQLAYLRQKPQSTKLNLSIFQPTAIFKAQINNASAAKGDRTITYDNVLLGSYTAISADMTMWVGTTPGSMNIGKVRVRSATSTQIVVSENSDIDWADNLYLTVFRYWELWPIYPHIILDPANNENVIFYKDYDIAYTNQNSVLGTFVNAGPHRAVFLDPASGQAQIYYSSTGSYNLLGDTLSYNWFFEGATVTGSSVADPGYITYNTAGHYVTRLSISGSSGGFDTTYRYVSVYDQAHPPIQRWQLNSIQGSRDEGGYTASFKVFDIIPIQEHAVVVLFGDSQYGSTQVNLGGNFPNASDIFFVGYIDKDSIQYDYEHSEISFDATSLTDTMKKSTGFSVSVQSKASPSKWYELLDMDSRRALYHYLRWHTTALNVADFQYVGNDYKVQFFDSDRESMYDAITNYMQNSLIGKTVSDRQGKVWMEIDAAAYPDPTGTFTTVMDISRNDWMNTPNIEERLTHDVSYMEYGGVQYSGVVTGTFNPLMSAAPGNAPGFYGTLQNQQGLVLGGQPHLNKLLGNLYANKNSPFPTIGLDMSINSSNLDIAPQETVGIRINPSDTVRNITIDGAYIPDSMMWKYDPSGYSLLPQIEYKQLVNGTLAETVTIPSVSDVGGGMVYDPFSLNFPPLPASFPPTSTDAGDGAPSKVIVHDPVAGLLFTNTFNTPSPQWYQINGGLTTTQYQDINQILVCPNGAIYVACTSTSVVGHTRALLARAPYAGAAFTVIENQASVDAKTGIAGSYICGLGQNKGTGESVLYAVGVNSDLVYTYLGAGNTFTAKVSFGGAYTNNGFAVSYGAGQWMYSVANNAILLGPNAAAVGSTISVGTYMCQHVRVGYGGTTIHWGNTATRTATNNAASVSAEIPEPGMTTTGYLKNDIVDVDATGSFLMAGGGNMSVPYRSSDGGYSWSAIGTLSIPQDDWRPCNGGGSYKWILARSYIYYTGDFGASSSSWADKRGNILSIAPLLAIDAIKVVP